MTTKTEVLPELNRQLDFKLKCMRRQPVTEAGCNKDADWIAYKRCCPDVAFICNEHLIQLKRADVVNECRGCGVWHVNNFSSFIRRVDPL